MVRCQCLKYIHIFMYIYTHSLTYTQMARERCGALSVLGRESVREAHAQNQQDDNPRKLPAVPTGPQPGHGATLRTSHVSRDLYTCIYGGPIYTCIYGATLRTSHVSCDLYTCIYGGPIYTCIYGVTLQTSHVSRERANWLPRERLGIIKERLGVRESAWALG